MKLFGRMRSGSQKGKLTVFLIAVLVLLAAGILAVGISGLKKQDNSETASSELAADGSEQAITNSSEDTQESDVELQAISPEEADGSNDAGASSQSSEESGTSGTVTSGNTGSENTGTDTTGTGTTESQETGSGEITQNTVQDTEEDVIEEDISCNILASFSGQFVEDGTDELVQNVAAILVTNDSDQFLDLASLQFEIDGQAATFMVTGLPAGKSAWVMEKSKLNVSGDSTFAYKGCVTSFRDNVAASTDKITITSDGNMLTATNNTQETLNNVFVYYKVLHTDGYYFGGITYLTNFGTLEPGASVEALAGHYTEGKTEIVRIGWQ